MFPANADAWKFDKESGIFPARAFSEILKSESEDFRNDDDDDSTEERVPLNVLNSRRRVSK